MRKWKCISVNDGNKRAFTIGKIYETDDKGYGIVTNNNIKCDNISILKEMGEIKDLKFTEVLEKEEDKKMDKFKVGDVVEIIGNKKSGHGFNVGEIVTITEICNNGREDEHCRAIGKSGRRWYVNYIDIRLENKSSTKTITITTSDTTTTLTDGTHTTSINRYYTDKHDDMIALEEVVKKYKREMEEIKRAEKMPKVGDKVKMVDSGETYDTNKSFLVENKDKINIETIIKWESGELPEKDNVYKVVFKKDNKFIVEDDNSSYIMNAKGLEVIK